MIDGGNSIVEGALALSEIPKKLVVIGAGYSVLEMGSVWGKHGSEVTVVEFASEIVTTMDAEIRKQFQRALEKQKMKFMLKTKVVGCDTSGDVVKLTLKSAAGGEPTILEADVVLVSAGKIPFTAGLGLEKIWVEMDKAGRMPVNEQFATHVPGVHAIGDVIPGPILAHKAEEDGVAYVEFIPGKVGHVDYDKVPSVVYTHPEVGSVGKIEEQVKAFGVIYRVRRFPFLANSRAKAIDDAEGIVKILTEETDKILGVHIMAPNADELIHEAVIALSYDATNEDIARVWDVNGASVKALVGNRTGNVIVKLDESIKMPEPKKVHHEELALNGLVAPLDVDIKGGGRVVVLNTKDLRLVGEVVFGEDLGVIKGITMWFPEVSCYSILQVTYILKGSHLEFLGVQVTWISGPWFLSIIINMLPWENVLRAWDVLLFEGNRVMLFRTALALMEFYGPTLAMTKDAVNAITLLQSLVGSTFDSSQLVLTSCMGFLPVTETRLHELRKKQRPAVPQVAEERSKKGRIWKDPKGLASKLYSFKHDSPPLPKGTGVKLAGPDGPNLENPSDLENFLGGLAADTEVDSLPDLQEQVVWLKVELCRSQEEKRSAILRAEELETALMDMVKQDHQRQLSAKVEEVKTLECIWDKKMFKRCEIPKTAPLRTRVLLRGRN